VLCGASATGSGAVVAVRYRPLTRARYGDINWRALAALAAGVAAPRSWQFGLVTEFQGPLAKTFSNTDLSWATGSLVAGTLYYVLVGRGDRRRAVAADRPPFVAGPQLDRVAAGPAPAEAPAELGRR